MAEPVPNRGGRGTPFRCLSVLLGPGDTLARTPRGLLRLALANTEAACQWYTAAADAAKPLIAEAIRADLAARAEDPEARAIGGVLTREQNELRALLDDHLDDSIEELLSALQQATDNQSTTSAQ